MFDVPGRIQPDYDRITRCDRLCGELGRDKTSSTRGDRFGQESDRCPILLGRIDQS